MVNLFPVRAIITAQKAFIVLLDGTDGWLEPFVTALRDPAVLVCVCVCVCVCVLCVCVCASCVFVCVCVKIWAIEAVVTTFRVVLMPVYLRVLLCGYVCTYMEICVHV